MPRISIAEFYDKRDFFFFKEMAILFSRMLLPFCSPTSNIREIQFQGRIWYCHYFCYFSYSNRYLMISHHHGVNSHFLWLVMMSVFSCAYLPTVYPFLWNACLYFLLIFYFGCFFNGEFWEFFTYSRDKSFILYMVCKYFL